MTISQARQVFAQLMETARKRTLTADEKRELTVARQMLRSVRKRQNPKLERNPNPKLIYGNVSQIKAEKQSGRFAGQRFFHDFKPGAKAYGLENGDILITTRKLK